jgi:hypothetical protein
LQIVNVRPAWRAVRSGSDRFACFKPSFVALDSPILLKRVANEYC